MHLDIALVAAGALVGLLVGLTGTGGGALMTPMLVLLFGVAPTTAIASDLVASVLMRPVGALVHWRRHRVDQRVVALLCAGSVPAAFAGTYVLHRFGTAAAEVAPQRLLGAALVIGGGAMMARHLLTGRAGPARPIRGATAATVLTGVVGGFLVGLTSVGAGSLMMMALMLLYPSMASDRLVGTDLAQSVPLALGASIGALVFGHVSLSITAALAIGAVPATLAGSLISSRRASAVARPLITAMVVMSGLKYLGLTTTTLAVALIPVGALVAASFTTQRIRTTRASAVASTLDHSTGLRP